MKNNNEVWVVIGKLPLEGFSKTRLAQEIGWKNCLVVYEALILDFFASFQKYNNNKLKLLFYGTPNTNKMEDYFSKIFIKLNIKNFEIRGQNNEPFFQKIKCIFKSLNEEFKNPLIHLTGTDIPDFPFELIKNEKKKIEKNISIGPDIDSGFYYLKTHASNFEIFDFETLIEEKIQTVFKAIVERSKHLSLNIAFLETWSDIDTLFDLKVTYNRMQVFKSDAKLVKIVQKLNI